MAFMRSKLPGTYGSGSLSPPMENMSASGHPFDIVVNGTSDTGSSLPQGPPPSDAAWINYHPSQIPACSHRPHFNAEIYPADLHPLTPSSSIRIEDINGGAKTFNHQIYNEDSSVVYFSDVMSQAGFSLITQMPPNSTENFQPVPVVPYDGATYIYCGNSLNRSREVALIDIASEQGHRYTQSVPTPTFSVPSFFSEASCIPAIVQCEKQGASRVQSKELPTPEREFIAASSRPSRRPDGRPGALRGRYLCDVCGKNYAQPQGVTRHQRDTHETSLCKYCGRFQWGRRYNLRNHIKKQHPDVDLDTALDEVTRTRRTIFRQRRPPQDSLHTPENNQRSRAELQSYPLMPPLSAVMEVPSNSLRTMLLVNHDPQPLYAELNQDEAQA